MAKIVCVPPPNIPERLLVNMPGMGELTFIRDSLERVPRPSEYVLKAMNNLAPALAPIYSLLRVLDVIIAIFNCQQAIKKAVTQLNPSPIINCFPKLFKAVAALVPLIPPLSYVRMVVDIVVLVRLLVDDILNIVTILDNRVTEVKQLISLAQESNDAELLGIGECAKDSLNSEAAGIMDIMQVIAKFIAVIMIVMDIMAEVLPGPAKDKIEEIKSQITGAQESLDGMTITDFPPLGVIQQNLVVVRNVLVYVETVGKAIVGMSFEFPVLTLEELANP